MNAMTILIFLALAATVFSLISGITAMATHGEVGHHGSNDWMFRRVGFQALAVVLLIVAMLLG
jgi:membrane protein implicated in regulation of membrane protease activity